MKFRKNATESIFNYQYLEVQKKKKV